jgi:hypothetical protein
MILLLLSSKTLVFVCLGFVFGDYLLGDSCRPTGFGSFTVTLSS